MDKNEKLIELHRNIITASGSFLSESFHYDYDEWSDEETIDYIDQYKYTLYKDLHPNDIWEEILSLADLLTENYIRKTKFTRDKYLDLNALILVKIKSTLIEEIKDGQSVADAIHKGDTFTTDGSDDVIYGRWEFASHFLEQIKIWEKLQTHE